VAYGFVVLFLLPPVPEKLKRGFSAEQKDIAVRRSKEAYNTLDAKIDLKQLLKLLKDPKSYFLSTSFHCSLSLFVSNIDLSRHLLLSERQLSLIQHFLTRNPQILRLFSSAHASHDNPGIRVHSGVHSGDQHSI
jgi:hypothetical protein